MSPKHPSANHQPTEREPRESLIKNRGGHFEGRWTVIAGDMVRPCPTDELAPPSRNGQTAVIERTDKEFQLCCYIDGHCEPLQCLEFNEASGTLENKKESGERRRCIAYWKPDGSKPMIFAMRKKAGTRFQLLPFEGDDNGTWGAEQEPLQE